MFWPWKLHPVATCTHFACCHFYLYAFHVVIFTCKPPKFFSKESSIGCTISYVCVWGGGMQQLNFMVKEGLEMVNSDESDRNSNFTSAKAFLSIGHGPFILLCYL